VILQAQEAVYDAKVQKVRDEHDQLLQEAFERAKVSFLLMGEDDYSHSRRMRQVKSMAKTYRLSGRSPRQLPNNSALHTILRLRVLMPNTKINSHPRLRPSRSSCLAGNSS
jgi:hypothetical protein